MTGKSGVAVDAAVEIPVAREVARRAAERWGERKPTLLVGRHRALGQALEHVSRFGASDEPILLTGETGTGKELFARAAYLFSPRCGRPLVAVNCAQYHDSQLMASELFGHRRGSFTGAVSDHRGLFEEADGGVIFLDEVGELSLAAQAMLLRVLGEGEIVPVGATQPKVVNVRVIAATSRELPLLVASGLFRSDLYYRLRYLQVHVPAVRERGGDADLLMQFFLRILAERRQAGTKAFTSDATALLVEYDWPGNVRELRSVVDTAVHLSEGPLVRPEHIGHLLARVSHEAQVRLATAALERFRYEKEQGTLASPDAVGAHGAPPTEDANARALARIERMTVGHESFWLVVHRPFLEREMSRAEAQAVIAIGLTRTRGSYKRLLPLFQLPDQDYLKFMDFLRHQQLKPK